MKPVIRSQGPARRQPVLGLVQIDQAEGAGMYPAPIRWLKPWVYRGTTQSSRQPVEPEVPRRTLGDEVCDSYYFRQ